MADPFMAFQFTVSVGSENGTQVIGGFSDVSGLAAETEVETLRVGGLNNAEVMLPGPTKFSSRLVLKRGITEDQDLWKWRSMVIDGKIKDARKNGQIILLDDEGKEAAEWTFTDGWPTKWTGPGFNATANEVAIDTLEITHEGLKRVK